jgi:hypothetical protein
LTDLLRRRGLNLQTSKTEILRGDVAKNKIEGVIPILESILKNYVSEIVSITGVDNPYLSLSEADKLITEEDAEVPLQIIRDAYKTYFIENSNEEFNKTLFHFLLNRLGSGKDKYAVDHALSLIGDKPEETETILKYISKVESRKEVEDRLSVYLESEDAVYPYQNFLILDWIYKGNNSLVPGIITTSRKLLFDENQPSYLRAISRIIIGKFGTTGDLERIESSYVSANTLERCEIIFALSRMEVSRRNSFYGRVEKDGPEIEASVRLVKGGIGY